MNSVRSHNSFIKKSHFSFLHKSLNNSIKLGQSKNQRIYILSDFSATSTTHVTCDIHREEQKRRRKTKIAVKSSRWKPLSTEPCWLPPSLLMTFRFEKYQTHYFPFVFVPSTLLGEALEISYF